MTQYLKVDSASQKVLMRLGLPDPMDFVGPPAAEPEAEDGITWVAYQEPVNFSAGRPTQTSVLAWLDGALGWIETAPLADRIAAAITKTYADIDAVVWDAVGNRTEEYKEAETDARAYKAASYADPVPPSVACYAQHNPTGAEQSGQWAADDIIVRADAFASAKLAMRQTRFASQSAMRAAATGADLDAAIAAWDGFIAALRAQLGL